MELKGTTAVITGSTGKLSCAIVEALAQRGCNCICHYCDNREKAQALVKRIQKFSVKALAVQADLTKPNKIELLFESALEFGAPQILINSAAIFTRTPLEKITFEESRKILDLNLTASILTAKAFAKVVKSEFDDTNSLLAKIINITDVAGIRPWAEYSLYSASKAGLIGATKSLAKEMAPNICVNSVAPGVVACANDLDSQQEKRQLSFIPLARFAEKKEIAAAVIFLLENDYITGQNIAVDGGRSV